MPAFEGARPLMIATRGPATAYDAAVSPELPITAGGRSWQILPTPGQRAAVIVIWERTSANDTATGTKLPIMATRHRAWAVARRDHQLGPDGRE
ncbi:hypothetical protein GCM10010464_46470 [Pseudonocardia yunnanensis]